MVVVDEWSHPNAKVKVSPYDARVLVARARALLALGADVSARPETLRLAMDENFRAVRTRIVREKLAAIPVARLREVTQGRVRLGLLEEDGLRTVLDVLDASPARLHGVPGVGEQTVAQVRAAARQLAHACEDETVVRLDPDVRDREQTQLLAALHALGTAEQAIEPLRDALDDLHDLRPLLTGAERAGHRMQMLLAGRRARNEAANSARTLATLLAGLGPLEDQLLRIVDQLSRPVTHPDVLWRDYEERASDYYALLGELGDLDLDVDKTQGFLPAEIAERVNEQQLDDSFLRVSLRGYQAFGAKFALVQRRTILGDEMGLGKTIEALAALAHLRALDATHFMTVCPASVLVNWTHEISRRSHLNAVRIHGTDRRTGLRAWARHGGVAVTTYETLRALEPPLDLKLSMLVVDEAHYAKNPEAQRSKAVAKWTRLTDRVLFLTGTPMENRVDEFRSLVRYLQPELLSNIDGVTGVVSPAAFRRGVAPVYLRRNQQDVLAELPERLEMEDWVELGVEDAAAYRDAVESGNFMAMRRAAFLPGTATGSAKLDRLVEIVEESAANGWKVVVFSYFRDVLEIVHDALDGAAVGPLTGSVAPTARQELVDRFTAIDGHAVLVSQIQAGGVGLNIQAASVVVLTEPQWKPTIEEQAIARCHRMGQVRRVHVHRLLAEDSVDERMLEILTRKAQIFDEYVRDSDLKDASVDAVDISDVDAARDVVSSAEAERLIITAERVRLGIASRTDDEEPEGGTDATG